MRVTSHPVLGEMHKGALVEIEVDGETIVAVAGEPIAAALLAAGRMTLRYTQKRHEPRGVFCAIGRCTDCMMVVDGISNVRTCITPVRAGMRIRTQYGLDAPRSDLDAGG